MQISHVKNNESALDIEDIKKNLDIENDFLVKLVDTIPAKMYFDSDIQEKITAEKHLTMDKAVEALKRKSNNFDLLSAKGKHKRARLDPLSQKSVSQIHNELNKKKRKKKKKIKIDMHNPSASLTRAANIEELQKRLHERIKLLQANRKHDPTAQRKQKNQLKKLKKQKGNLLKAQAEKAVKVDKTPEKKTNDKSNEKPVFNKEGNFLYSKFDFSEEGQGENKKSEYAGKKTKILLKNAEKKKEKLDKLKEVDPQKAELIAEKEKWKKAIQKSEGIKVRDDPKLLKKSLKLEKKKKKKSAKVWRQRTEEVEKKKKVRQEKRTQNIQAKKKEKRDRKIKLLKKKGRVITNV